MKTYRLSIILSVLCPAFTGYAKKKEFPRAEIRVGYTYHETFVRGSDGIIERNLPFVLLANNTYSKFYCPLTEYKDSMNSTPSGRAISTQLLHEAINRYIDTQDRSAMNNVVYKTQLYVFKSIPDNEYTVYDYIGMPGHFYYKKPLENIEWNVGDSVRQILGYECIMATADYHGRQWTAWFSPDIPVQDGPWKLCGLPGLILEATESTNQYYFIADGIEVSNQAIVPIYDKKKYDKITRKEMLRHKRNATDHSSAMMSAELGINAGPDHIRNEEEAKIDFLETDYH